MGSGIPDYQKLYEMGKLPDSQRHQIPMLRELDKKNKEIDELKKGTSAKTPQTTTIETPQTTSLGSFECLVKDCVFVGKNANGLRLHQKKHIIK